MSNVYEEYAALEAEEKMIKAKKEVLRLAITKTMIEEGLQKLDSALGKFSITLLKKWQYPESVVELGEKFKAAKAKAESTGDATYEEEASLRFTAVKL